MRPRLESLSLRGKLWIGALALFALIATAAIMQPRSKNADPASHHGMGLDFIAFYRAGTLVREGHADRLYDLADTRSFEQALAARESLPLGDKLGPFYNPPLVAWFFAPLSALSYRTALHLWLAINFAAFAAACVLLCRMIPVDAEQDSLFSDRLSLWLNRALVPVLIVVSMPFLQAIGHGQNSCISLLILAATVTAWRAKQAARAGLLATFLFYKPQLGAVVLAAIALDLGWSALFISLRALAVLLLLNVLTLPGTLTDYVHRLGPNLAAVLASHPYIWQRHVTFRAFWHLLLHRESPALAVGMTLLCTAALTIALLYRLRSHRQPVDRDRTIAAVITAAPLLMPYYLDYDLLLLAVPAVMIAVQWINGQSRRPWELRAWIALYMLLMIDAGLTGALHVNLAIPLLAIVAAQCIRQRSEAMDEPLSLDRGWIEQLRSNAIKPAA